MTDLIRSLIQESMLELGETSNDLLQGLEHGDETVIGDRREAEAFAKNHLMRDIPELANYQLVEYLPINPSKEKWMFDAQTSRGTINTVTIKHIIKNGISHWKFTFGEAQQSMERMVADIGYQTPLMPDYGDFVGKVNADWQQWG